MPGFRQWISECCEGMIEGIALCFYSVLIGLAVCATMCLAGFMRCCTAPCPGYREEWMFPNPPVWPPERFIIEQRQQPMSPGQMAVVAIPAA
jgi:hypothetical protein